MDREAVLNGSILSKAAHSDKLAGKWEGIAGVGAPLQGRKRDAAGLRLVAQWDESSCQDAKNHERLSFASWRELLVFRRRN